MFTLHWVRIDDLYIRMQNFGSVYPVQCHLFDCVVQGPVDTSVFQIVWTVVTGTHAASTVPLHDVNGVNSTQDTAQHALLPLHLPPVQVIFLA